MTKEWMGLLDSKLTDEQIQLLKRQINPKLIKQNKYDKYGDGNYIDVETFYRIMNEIFQYQWSWEIIDYQEEEEYVYVRGRLSIPGIGVKEGFGSARKDKKDNSTALSVANAFALKTCARMIGIGASVLNEDYHIPLWKNSTNTETQVEKKEEKTKIQEEEQEEEWTEELQKKFKDLRETYKIKSKNELLAFARIWDPDIQEMRDITPRVFEALYDYVAENPEEFEGFNPDEVA